jgi:hypothetical protein
MDVDKLFALFDHKNGDKPLSENDNTIIELYETPLFWISMFEKLIQNNNAFNHQLELMFKHDEHYDPGLLIEAGDIIVYSRAYSFIEMLDLNNDDHRNALLIKFKQSYLVNNLTSAMNFFIKYEEYEKCAVIKEILKLSQENLEV